MCIRDRYYTVFRRVNKQLPQLTTLELRYVSPALLGARSLDLAVPGTYRVDGAGARISRFSPSVHVITSKQRPRRLAMKGEDGREYGFLLKGHEDLRQDERAMQLFGLANALLAKDRRTREHGHLSIQRYAVTPLSHNCGVVGWVPACDTLHALVRDFRDARKIVLNVEHRVMLQLAPDYDALSLPQKVEVFDAALANTAGHDLSKVLWLKSSHSEQWLERRTHYARSLAAMSMVGHILGLGDRHPSNLMLDRRTGKVLHIDFGDCFEVAMHRDKFPERVPFRLTRMLVNAMEVSGVEGTYRATCERVMRVLRDNRDSLLSMLEAFIHDPLISWRLLGAAAEPDAAVDACYTDDKGFGAVFGLREQETKDALAKTGVAYEYGTLPRGFMKTAPHKGFDGGNYPGPPMIWMSKRWVQPGRNPAIASAFAKVGDLQYYSAPAFLSAFEYTAEDNADQLWSLRWFNDYDMGHVAHFPKTLLSWIPTRVLFTMIPNLKGGLGAEYPVGLSFSTKENIDKAIAYNAGNKAYDQHYWEDVIGPLPDMGKGQEISATSADKMLRDDKPAAA